MFVTSARIPISMRVLIIALVAAMPLSAEGQVIPPRYTPAEVYSPPRPVPGFSSVHLAPSEAAEGPTYVAAGDSLPPPAEPFPPGPPLPGDVHSGAGGRGCTEPSAAGRAWPHPTSPLCKSRWLAPFETRALAADNADQAAGPAPEAAAMPSGFVPWWRTGVASPRHTDTMALSVNVQTLIYEALQHSPFIRAASDSPLIRETGIVEAQADFDVTAFMESKFDDISEPVGNLLETGGPDRFRDHNWTYSAGVRKRMSAGGNLEIAQQFGYQDNNSNFFVPTQQGRGRLTLNYTQPLLNGYGQAINSRLIVLAELETGIAWDQFAGQLQNHLLEVTRSYWELYMWRATLLQKKRHLARAEEILNELEVRKEIDALESQIVRARAAVATRSAELARAETAIRNAETRIRTLVNAPRLRDVSRPELIPVEPPTGDYVAVGTRDALLTALQNRSEVDEALRRIQAGSIELKVSRNELLPILDFVMETYVSGLEGDSEVGRAWVNQFREGEPSYSVGLQLEIPLGNRAARARYQRRRIELRQLMQQFHSSVDQLMGEVEVAVREVHTSYREMQGHYRSMLANEADANYLYQRWQLLPGDDRAASFVLEDLLEAQDRLAVEEFAFVQAQMAYTLSLTAVQRAMGTLLAYEQVSAHRVCDDGTPRLVLAKPPTPETIEAPVDAPANRAELLPPEMVAPTPETVPPTVIRSPGP